MASDPQDVSSGVAIDFGTSTSFSPLLKNYKLPEISVDDIETTHQDSDFGTDFPTKRMRTYIPGDFIEGEEIEGEFYFNPDTVPPIGISQQITVTFGSGATWVFPGYLKKYGGDQHQIGDAMMIRGALKIAGDLDITGAS